MLQKRKSGALVRIKAGRLTPKLVDGWYVRLKKTNSFLCEGCIYESSSGYCVRKKEECRAWSGNKVKYLPIEDICC